MCISAVTAQEPLSGQTIVVSEPEDEAVFTEAIRSSREKYAKKVIEEKSQKVDATTETNSKPVVKKRSNGSVRDRDKKPS